MTARGFLPKGFTLIEFFLMAAVLAILFGLSTPYLFGTKEKALLEVEREKIVNALKTAQQKAIAAYEGYDYTVGFDTGNNRVTLQPEGKIISLHPKIELLSSNPESITFYRLTGKPSSSLEVTIGSQRFKCLILTSQEGVITTTPPERK